jgi:ech hydrogenase subunit C
MHYDASSCNGCDIEVLACLMPRFDVERFGVMNTGNPKHADILLITGSVNEQTLPVVRNIYAQMPEPKVVCAVGICGCSGGIFRSCYNVIGGVDVAIPVDVYVPGCAARPEAIIDGVVRSLAVLEEKRAFMLSTKAAAGEPIFSRAEKKDLPEILALQKIAYKSEAEIYGDASCVPPMRESLVDLETLFDKPGAIFVKAVVNGKIIGAIRAQKDGDVGQISRLAVHPYFQGNGLGHRLAGEIEKELGDAKAFEAITGHKSTRNLHLYEKLGYLQVKTEPGPTPAVEWVHLRKEHK